MAEYEGIVAALKENGEAEVVIRPGSAGIPGVSEEVSNKVCHCTTDSSAVTIAAENEPGAHVGDQVLIHRETGALIKNVLALTGFPAIGLILGIIAAYGLTDGFSTGAAAGIIAIAVGLFIGIAVGVGIFRRISGASQASIRRVIRTQASISQETSCPVRKKDSLCDSCAGPFSS
ncbi:MAG: SoxR reducing system RseC family protein [Desulfatiglandaceae bacterium]|jgi:hypothetical protein